MDEVIFLVEESEDGGYIAKGLGVSIFTKADTIDELKVSLKEAVHCHFFDEKPRLIQIAA